MRNLGTGKLHTSPIMKHDLLRHEELKLRRDIISPTTKLSFLKDTTSVAAIHFRQRIVTWVVMQCDYTILDWSEHIFQGLGLDTYNLISAAHIINQRLPHTDLYVIEDHGVRTNQSASNVYRHTHIQIFNAGLLGMLAERQRSPALSNDQSHIYSMKAFATATYFHLNIGKQTMTSNYVTDAIIPALRFDNDAILQKYNNGRRIEKEEMGWALLKAIAFINLCYRKIKSPQFLKNITNG